MPLDDVVPVAKRAKLESHPDVEAAAALTTTETVPGFATCTDVLGHNFELPKSLLQEGKIASSVAKLKALFDGHGLRTSLLSAPRAGLSVYKDSFSGSSVADQYHAGTIFLAAMFGLHREQEHIERAYSKHFKTWYCLLLFCQRMRILYTDEVHASAVLKQLEIIEQLGMLRLELQTPEESFLLAQGQTTNISQIRFKLICELFDANGRYSKELLHREFDQIVARNCTFSNALVSRFQAKLSCTIKDINYKQSPSPKHERMTIFLYDLSIDHKTPESFIFLPSLHLVMRKGVTALCDDMITTFWETCEENGYICSGMLQHQFGDDLKRFFLGGINVTSAGPVPLNAHFTPTSPLAVYVHGKAGAGKSSFVRNFSSALEAAIGKHSDPEILVRFVKQNLNKGHDVLKLEFELRPNNNDLSIMSIVQGRRMTRAQTKPGLVVLGMEEMPSNDAAANPNQLDVAQLISQRFSGRCGDFAQNERHAPRNAARRGIHNDSSIVTIFTSNYALANPCKNALCRLSMFKNLAIAEMASISGLDRRQFGESYLARLIVKHLKVVSYQDVYISLNLNFGCGDIRPLVQRLQVLAFYAMVLADRRPKNLERIDVRIVEEHNTISVKLGQDIIRLGRSEQDILYPVERHTFDVRVRQAMERMKRHESTILMDGLPAVLDFWLAGTLAPAVIISTDEIKTEMLFEAVTGLRDIRSIGGINADEYKMMKSLYDPIGTPNLRDDILKFGHGCTVAIELSCPTKDAQLCIREMIEDSPSMTAFSSASSALKKTGLLFVVHVEGPITPELNSRASIIV